MQLGTEIARLLFSRLQQLGKDVDTVVHKVGTSVVMSDEMSWKMTESGMTVEVPALVGVF